MTPRSKAITTLQKLRRLQEADYNGYCSCASCGLKFHWKELDGGHFLPKGNSSFHALNPDNIWPQCKYCNNWGMRHGIAAQQYTLFMEEKFGKEFVREMIDTKGQVKKISKVEYQEMIDKWKAEIKEHLERVG